MKRRTQVIWGIILIVIGFSASFGRVSENLFNNLPWYIVPGTNSLSKCYTLAYNYMALIGGIILLIPWQKNAKDTTSAQCNNDIKPFKKNGMCITAFVVSVISFLLANANIVPVLPILSIVFAILGTKRANKNNQKGQALAKWALTIAISAMLSAISLAIIETVHY